MRDDNRADRVKHKLSYATYKSKGQVLSAKRAATPWALGLLSLGRGGQTSLFTHNSHTFHIFHLP
jgi:hypothetical protein